MISEEDSMSTYEYDWHYKSLPPLNHWHNDPNRIKAGTRVEEGFAYSSGDNLELMSIEQLNDFLDSNEYQRLQERNL